MDADEKLTALKKAYADIILNTAKESAARIMVSERKSVRLQHELNVTKEQAIRMLLRLKQTMDDKISEAETTSLTQQRKIEVLEAQLQEAEDIVKDLREELREVQDELERLRNSKLHCREECNSVTHYQTSKEKGFNSSQPILFTPPESKIKSLTTVHMKKSAFDQSNDICKSYQENGDGKKSNYIVKSNIPSILEEASESMFESFTVSDVKIPPLGNTENGFHTGNSFVGKPDLPSIILRSKGSEPYRNRRTQRIRAFEEKLMAGELSFSDTIDEVTYEDSDREDGEDEGICKTPGHKADTICSAEKEDVLPAVQKVKSLKRKRKKFTRYKKKKIPSSGLLCDQALDRDQASDISCRELNSNDNTQSVGNPLHMLSRLSEVIQDLSEDAQVPCTLMKCTGISESDGFSETVNDESGFAVLDKVDAPVVSSQAQVSNPDYGFSKQHGTDRVFKYTFQRKRKKVPASSSNGKAPVEKNILKENEANKQNSPMDMDTISLSESSRDSRRVAQVARQLISLSESKWR